MIYGALGSVTEAKGSAAGRVTMSIQLVIVGITFSTVL
jgi:hypothetical protein